MRIPTAVRLLVYTRDERRCIICTQHLRSPQLHHRKPRGMGGTSLPTSFATSNLITLCGTCHLVNVERNRDQAVDFGWLVRQAHEPAQIPLLYKGKWARLDDEGGVVSIV